MPASGLCRTGIWPVSGSTPSQRWLTSQFSTNTANASVVTARYRPGMRSAGIPMTSATAAPTSTPNATATPHGTLWRPNQPSPTRRTVTSPPIAEKPNWPSESCPAHPLRIVSEHPAIAKISTRVQRNDCDAWVANAGMTARTTSTAARPRRGSWRTTHVSRTCSGNGLVRPPSFHDGSESAARARRRRERQHDDERRDEQPEREHVRVGTGDVLLEDHLDDAERHAHRHREPQDPHPGDHGDEERLHQHGVAEGELRGAVGGTERGHELHGGEDDEGRRGERGGDPPDERRGPRDRDAHETRLVGVAGSGAHHEPESRPGHDPREQDHEDRHRDQHADLARGHLQLGADLPAPLLGNQGREVAARRDVGQQLGEDQDEEAEQLRDPDRGHQQHESRRARAAARGRVLEPADDQHLHGHRDDRGERHRHDQARPEGPPVLGQQPEEAERDRAESDDGEVHDAAGPEHEDEPGGDGAVGEADHRTGEHHLLRDVPAVDVDHRAALPPCVRGWYAARAARLRARHWRTIHLTRACQMVRAM